jgi:Mg2+-importing ATPase
VISTYQPFDRTPPGRRLRLLLRAMSLDAAALPYVPGLTLFGFVPLPLPLLAALVGMTLAYVAAIEFAKRRVGRFM